MWLSARYQFLPKQLTAHAAIVMDHFGIGFETGENVIADGLSVPIQERQVVLFSGPSGSGKSTLMRAAAEQLSLAAEQLSSVLWVDHLDLGSRLLVDSLNLPAADALNVLTSCGLGEGRLLLRTPAELSDGQRYRFRLAMAVARRPQWIVADEFTAAWDRPLAKVMAFNVRRLCDRFGIGFLLATTHEDIVDDLRPDVQVQCHSDGCAEVHCAAAQKKTASRSHRNCGFRGEPSPTGRTSLGGITAATTLDS
jgi:uncharacterized protein